MKKKDEPFNYGGQAVMEGVMMRGRSKYAMAVRKPGGDIELVEEHYTSAGEKFPILKWPLIRGVAAMVSSLIMGFKTLTQSAEICGAMEDEEPVSRFGRFLQAKLGDKLNDLLMQLSVVIAVVIAVGLFMLLPAFIGSLLSPLLNGRMEFMGAIEGIIRIMIFVLYVYLVSLSKDMRRVFEYHGAEHKTINCYERRLPLTAENITESSRLHKRCGTSFLLVVMVISMLVFMFIRTGNIWLRFASRIALLPVIAGLSYEISVKYAGRRDNILVRIIIFPGMCLQRLTTAEPDEGQIETAVTALKAVLDESEKTTADDI